MILLWWLGGILNGAPFASEVASNNFVLNYGCVNNFAQFWLCPYGTHNPSNWLGWSLTLGHTKEFACVVKVLILLALVLASLETINVLLALHSSNTNFPCLSSLLDFQLESNFELFLDSFKLTFLCMFHLSIGGPFGIIFEHFQDFFYLENLISGFIQVC